MKEQRLKNYGQLPEHYPQSMSKKCMNQVLYWGPPPQKSPIFSFSSNTGQKVFRGSVAWNTLRFLFFLVLEIIEVLEKQHGLLSSPTLHNDYKPHSTKSAHGLKKDHQYFRYFRKFSVIFLLSTSFFFWLCFPLLLSFVNRGRIYV